MEQKHQRLGPKLIETNNINQIQHLVEPDYLPKLSHISNNYN